jgi:acyl carrier protein
VGIVAIFKFWLSGASGAVRKGMADYANLVSLLCELIQKYNRKSIALTEESSLTADVGLSSLEVMELVEQIEDHLDISIPLNILPHIDSIGDLATKLQELTP